MIWILSKRNKKQNKLIPITKSPKRTWCTISVLTRLKRWYIFSPMVINRFVSGALSLYAFLLRGKTFNRAFLIVKTKYKNPRSVVCDNLLAQCVTVQFVRSMGRIRNIHYATIINTPWVFAGKKFHFQSEGQTKPWSIRPRSFQSSWIAFCNVSIDLFDKKICLMVHLITVWSVDFNIVSLLLWNLSLIVW